jgi:hypothetical protein
MTSMRLPYYDTVSDGNEVRVTKVGSAPHPKPSLKREEDIVNRTVFSNNRMLCRFWANCPVHERQRSAIGKEALTKKGALWRSM